MVRAIATGLALLALIGAACAAEEIPDGRMPPPATPADALCRAVAVVTGTRIETRLPGFAQCLGDVLVKVTGDHAVLADRRLPRAAKDAPYVVRFSYHDRLGRQPWPAPCVAALVAAENVKASFARDGTIAAPTCARPWPMQATSTLAGSCATDKRPSREN